MIAFDDTFDKLTQLGHDRTAAIKELAHEAFADVLKKHGIPIDLKDTLRKCARFASAGNGKTTGAKNKPGTGRKVR